MSKGILTVVGDVVHEDGERLMRVADEGQRLAFMRDYSRAPEGERVAVYNEWRNRIAEAAGVVPIPPVSSKDDVVVEFLGGPDDGKTWDVSPEEWAEMREVMADSRAMWDKFVESFDGRWEDLDRWEGHADMYVEVGGRMYVPEVTKGRNVLRLCDI
jgi:hypothetical protein